MSRSAFTSHDEARVHFFYKGNWLCVRTNTWSPLDKTTADVKHTTCQECLELLAGVVAETLTRMDD